MYSMFHYEKKKKEKQERNESKRLTKSILRAHTPTCNCLATVYLKSNVHISRLPWDVETGCVQIHGGGRTIINRANDRKLLIRQRRLSGNAITGRFSCNCVHDGRHAGYVDTNHNYAFVNVVDAGKWRQACVV